MLVPKPRPIALSEAYSQVNGHGDYKQNISNCGEKEVVFVKSISKLKHNELAIRLIDRGVVLIMG